jgi:hypothetical protein
VISDFDKRTVEAAVRSAVMDACWVGRGGYNIPVAEALVTKALGVIWNVLPTTTKADAILALLASPSPNPQEAEGWKPMADAPRGTYFEPWTATPILAKLKSPIPCQGRPDLEPWAGRYVVVQHTGISPDGFDIGWNVAAPVGAGGLPDEWFVGWRPIEDAASPTPQEAGREG